ncbi:hypothetical protein PF005_g4201 [Phytophthora fragariae]|uniref:Uncharacterized protein n=1 Tax=Phytophthora fragariae TaxID=53985 RepID=A0A6A3UUE0_9STRA|nr:hypothetical protein PF003_g23457 [Phytophthora fragariae]KAE8945717.1 hypothetical protein PF009_g4623 [Phytophthora fragariae]KAE9023472.1 hypothetical protein PF011_g3980 [Phytophthora fragariae]KAE9129524.1 hypothetical protein PF010_g4165 [Phytophthora fragariae]KAE9133699.1 hypothetical protein PF007_g3250 [Phytophthora fragariae]
MGNHTRVRIAILPLHSNLVGARVCISLGSQVQCPIRQNNGPTCTIFISYMCNWKETQN